jgi:hypothetical protein
MFEFRTYRASAWPEHLRPLGEGTVEKETFEAWWARHSAELGHLHPMLVEQWVYRHWDGTDFQFLPLDTLRWDLVVVEGEQILRSVRREIARNLDPDFDYEQLQGLTHFEKSETAIELDAGTWIYPIIALSTPSGWIARHAELPDERLMLVEGHQRHRYLNALHAKELAPSGSHQVFIIHSPLVT